MTLFLLLIVKFNNFRPWLAWIGLITAELGPKRGENSVLKSREYYYIVFYAITAN